MRNSHYMRLIILMIVFSFTATQSMQQSFSKNIIAVPTMVSLGLCNAYFVDNVIERVPNIYLRLLSLITYASCAIPCMYKISSLLDKDEEQQKNLAQIGFASSGLYMFIKKKNTF